MGSVEMLDDVLRETDRTAALEFLAEIEAEAITNDLSDFALRIRAGGGQGPEFKDHFNNSFNKGFGNYGKS